MKNKESNFDLEDQIKSQYANSVIFVTGGTGYIGDVLLKTLALKLNCKKIYALYRSTPLFEHPIIEWVKGDIKESKFGLTDEQYIEIQSSVNFIFHLAANVRWDKGVLFQVTENTIPSLNICEFSLSCPKLNACMVSSSFHAWVEKDAESVFINESIELGESDPEIDLADIISGKEQSHNLLNGYAYSKQLMERIIKKRYAQSPIVIIRKAGVSGAYEFPIRGLSRMENNPLMSIRLLTEMGAKYLPKTMNTAITDTIPVDFCVNVCILSLALFQNQLKLVNAGTGLSNIPYSKDFVHDFIIEQCESQTECFRIAETLPLKAKKANLKLLYFFSVIFSKKVLMEVKTIDSISYELSTFPVKSRKLVWTEEVDATEAFLRPK